MQFYRKYIGYSALVGSLILVPIILYAGGWSYIDSYPIPVYGQTMTLLQNGKILIAGGNIGSANILDCYLFDPSSNAFVVTGSMSKARSGHTATLLSDGKVLVVGGGATCEIYNPSSETWSTTTAPTYASRTGHTATLLQNGKVLLAGGYSSSYYLALCSIYDPSNAQWTSTGSLSRGRDLSKAVLLNNGSVLVTGGWADWKTVLSTCEIYYPSTGTWSTTGSMSADRSEHFAVLLKNGRVLIGGDDYYKKCEIFDPSTGKWSATDTLRQTFSSSCAAVLLQNGEVLVTGGQSSVAIGTLKQCLIYNVSTGKFRETNALSLARYGHKITLLNTGKVLVLGGINGRDLTSSAELFDGLWLTTPLDGQTLTGGTSTHLTWNTVYAGFSKFALLLSTDGGVTFATTISGNISSSSTSFDWPVNKIKCNQCRIKLQILNNSGDVIAEAQSQSDFSITIPAPTASSGTATKTGNSKIYITGTVNPNGISTSYHFEYGKTTSLGNSTTTKSAGAGTSNLTVGDTLTDLASGETYYFNIVAISDGGSSKGDAVSFNAPTGIPALGDISPNKYCLYQNNPNPFNPQTIINYNLPSTSIVKIIVCDIRGTVLSVIRNEREGAGEKHVTWDANEYPSGVYFYRLDATSIDDPTKHFSQVRKMILVK